jgi:hypothetical protein
VPTVAFREGIPTFYVNETFTPTLELANLDMASVAYIKVFNPPFMGGGQYGSGAAIAIYTKRGGDINTGMDNFKSNEMEFKLLSGYTPYKEFYSPSYAETQQSYDIKDLRSTLLWSPWINLGKINHTIKLTFYNNDVTNSFRVILEGMDGKGRLVHISKVIK